MARTRRRQRNGGKVVAILIAVVLLLAAGGCAGAWGTGFALTGEANPLKWKNGPVVPPVEYDDPDVEYGKYGYLVVSSDPEEGAPVALHSSRQYINSEPKDVVTATVTPADADIFGVVWESSDSSSVVVTPIEDDKLSCKLTCVNTFDEPVTVTCTVYSLETISATCTVDCLVSPGNAVQADLYNKGGGSSSSLGFGYTYEAVASPAGTWEGGTVTGELRVNMIVLYLTNAFVDELNNLLDGFNYGYRDFDTLGNEITLPDTPHACFNDSDIDEEAFRAAFAQACYKLGDNCVQVEFQIEYAFRDKVYKTYFIDYYYGFDASTFVKGADDVTINPDNPVFGS